jgi:hypothetical protein
MLKMNSNWHVSFNSAMNIFVLSTNPREAAEFHCDKHVVKMILETAQLLYTAHWLTDPDALDDGAYRKTHPNHPCALWARESKANYQWLCHLGFWLCEEYTHRYGKVHKTAKHLEWLGDNIPELPNTGLTPFRLAMPVEFKRANPVDAYRAYYLGAKVRMLAYTKRTKPAFVSSNDLHDRRG